MKALVSILLAVMSLIPSGARLFGFDAETGYAIIEVDSRYGAVDARGDPVIPCEYVQPFAFCEGYALVRGEGFTYVDKAGALLTDQSWEYAFPFSGGYARVCENGLYGAIDTTGALVVPCEYEALSDEDVEELIKTKP